jgi:quercetin dioxygenase-like cupin family protein
MRFKLPKGYRVPPHTLSKPGTFTVIAGTFRIGMGEKTDPGKARAMPARSFIALPPDTPHVPWMRRWFSSTISARG